MKPKLLVATASEVTLAPSGFLHLAAEYLPGSFEKIEKSVPVIGLGFPEIEAIAFSKGLRDNIEPEKDILTSFEYLKTGSFNIAVVINGQKAKPPLIIFGESDEVSVQTVSEFLNLRPSKFYIAIYFKHERDKSLPRKAEPGPIFVYPTIHFTCTRYIENHPHLHDSIKNLLQL